MQKPSLKVLASAILLGLPLSAQAQPVSFDGSWKNQGFPFLSKNEYVQSGNALEIISDDAVSILYKGQPESGWGARSASWSWSVSQSVPPTDLNQRKGEDRNISIYFVFLDKAEAERLKGASVRKLFRAKSARMLVYVWGGAEGINANQPFQKGRAFRIVKHFANTGNHSQDVDLAADFKRAFGKEPEALFGLAISADSDDTDTSIRAAISNFTLN